jgi:hypothetical protein
MNRMVHTSSVTLYGNGFTVNDRVFITNEKINIFSSGTSPDATVLSLYCPCGEAGDYLSLEEQKHYDHRQSR